MSSIDERSGASDPSTPTSIGPPAESTAPQADDDQRTDDTAADAETGDDTAEGPYSTAQPARYGVEHALNLVSVYRADDEMTARVIQGALTSNDIPAYIHSEQAPMFGTILRTDHGCWGEVMVPAAYQEQALALVDAFSGPSTTTDEELETQAMAADASSESV